MKNKLNASVLIGLRYFSVAAQHANFTKAADELHVTQGAVSQQIRHLEERLGIALFQRQARGLVLTEEGRRLYISAAKSFLDIEETLTSLTQAQTSLSINCSPSFALQWLIPRLGGFQRLHPEIEVKVKAEYQALNRVSIQNGEIDVAIRFDQGDYGDVHVTRLMDEYLLPVASPQFLAANPELLAARRIADHQLLHDAAPWDGAPPYVEWRTWLARHQPDMVEHCEGPQFNLSVLAIGAALAGQGIAMARSALVADELSSGRLVDLFQLPTLAPARYILLTARQDDGRIKDFTDWLAGECARFEQARNGQSGSVG